MIQIEAAQEILIRLSAAACCVMMTPGTVSRISPLRNMGRSANCAAPTVPSVAESAIPSRLSALPVTTVSGSRTEGSAPDSRADTAASALVASCAGARATARHAKPAAVPLTAVGASRPQQR